MAFGKKGKKVQEQSPTDVAPGETGTQLPPEQMELMDGSAAVSGAPVEADDTVTLKVSELDAMMDARITAAVAKALAAQPQVQAQAGGNVNAVEIAKAVAQVLVANQNVQSNNEHDRRMQAALATEAKREKCPTCGQSVVGCGGPWLRASQVTDPRVVDILAERGIDASKYKPDAAGYLAEANGRRLVLEELNHVRMSVFPKNDENAEWFTGLRINGKTYLSNGAGHEIWVPATNDFAAILSGFENGERRSRQQLKHVRQSGSVSANGRTNVSAPTFSH